MAEETAPLPLPHSFHFGCAPADTEDEKQNQSRRHNARINNFKLQNGARRAKCAVDQESKRLSHQANQEYRQRHQVWKPTPEAPRKVANVLQPSYTDAVGEDVHARSCRKCKIFVQLHAFELLQTSLHTSRYSVGSASPKGRGIDFWFGTIYLDLKHLLREDNQLPTKQQRNHPDAIFTAFKPRPA